MSISKSCLTILFEEPFWVGLYERECGGSYEVCKVTFGAEPRDYQVFDFFLKHWNHLEFSPSLETAPASEQKINPKRLQRQIRRETANAGMGTKAQQALKLQQEQRKSDRNTRSRQEKEAEKERQFALRREKRKQKHRGH